jgi:large subunit ribosomal protein L24e
MGTRTTSSCVCVFVCFQWNSENCKLMRAYLLHTRVQIAWTVLYRRKHKKNIEHETSKRRVRKTAKTGRAIANLTQEDVMKRRNEKPDFRKVQREQAIKAAKEKAKAARNRAKAASKSASGARGKTQIKSTKAQGRGKR